MTDHSENYVAERLRGLNVTQLNMIANHEIFQWYHNSDKRRSWKTLFVELTEISEAVRIQMGKEQNNPALGPGLRKNWLDLGPGKGWVPPETAVDLLGKILKSMDIMLCVDEKSPCGMVLKPMNSGQKTQEKFSRLVGARRAPNAVDEALVNQAKQKEIDEVVMASVSPEPKWKMDEHAGRAMLKYLADELIEITESSHVGKERAYTALSRIHTLAKIFKTVIGE